MCVELAALGVMLPLSDHSFPICERGHVLDDLGSSLLSTLRFVNGGQG